jgi:hypothetical protein
VLKGGPFVLIRVSLIYRGRAIPLAWRVIRHASATVAYAAYQPALRWLSYSSNVKFVSQSGLEVRVLNLLVSSLPRPSLPHSLLLIHLKM